MIGTYGRFATRKEAMADAKSNLFRDWFVLVEFDDGSFDYAAPDNHLTLQHRAKQDMYNMSRASGRWYKERED